MAVDYGTDWFKVALVKPGIPLDIVLNRDSKRKTASVINIRGEERIYGSDAINLGARFPFNTYFSLKKIIGRLADDVYSKEYQSIFPNKIMSDPIRGTVTFQHNETNVFSVEELLAMQLSHAKELAEITAHETIKDVVITVPSYYNQFERQAVLDAAELAGLNVLSLINEETAVGLNYAISHYSSFTEEPQYHLFYDIGAGSTKASLISFKTVSVKDVGRFNKTIIKLDVISTGYDRTLGGQEIDVRLQRYLAKQFDKTFSDKLKESIFKSPRAMTRLLKEANRIKQILSANTETIASVKSLHEGRDFRLPITRSELESMISDLIKRVGRPIQDALKNAKMSFNKVQSCVLVGGGIRVPSIQAKIKEIVGEDKVAQNINGDEAAVLGAAFRGASLSRQFKVKEIKIKDITPYPLEVVYESEPREVEPVGARKLMTFKRVTDFDFMIQYGKLNEAVAKDFGPKDIATFKITGLIDAFKKFEDIDSEKPKVKVTLQLSESGFVTATDAIATLEQPTFTDKVKTFFGVNKNQSEESLKEVPFSEVKTIQKRTKIETVDLNLEINYLGIKPLGGIEKIASIQKLRQMDDSDRQRRSREEARNNLESFVYRIQDLLDDPDIIKVTTEKQRKELSLKASETSEWLYDEGEEASTDAFRMRLRTLKTIEQPIIFRRDELSRRPEAIFSIQSLIKSVRAFANRIITNLTAENNPITELELNRLMDTCFRVEEWLEDKLYEQERIPPHVDPVLVSSDIQKKAKEIQRELSILEAKKRAFDSSSFTKASNDPQSTKSNSQTTKPVDKSSTDIPRDEL
ncbi:6183_t:CDS:10 [Diversispora eburnea]|uniref:6183_t:CDS:1 n=1 Tax=Diversispora eburnea TaxID=1213867 RepID=A0A9N9AGP4_9GLOM|nr:6183_t:CDS:10 [Diversispora eburnea]